MPAANRLPQSSNVSLLGQLKRLAPVPQENPVGLVRDEQVKILGLHANSIAHGVRHFGNLPIAAGQHLGDLAFGEPDAEFAGPGLPPLPGRVRSERHLTGVFAVGTALDIENGRLVGQGDQAHRGRIAGDRRLRLAPNSRLIEDLSCGILCMAISAVPRT